MKKTLRTAVLTMAWAVVNVVIAPIVHAELPDISVASATTIENSGLYSAILPVFTQQTGISVRVHSVGTGHAINMARSGDADILLVHHQASERKFVEEGYGVKRFDLMYNDFVLIGPENDPAGVAETGDIHEAMNRIAKTQSKFVSRADDSGTYKKEQAIWRDLNLDVTGHSGRWYLETGAGMGTTLNIANGLGAYTLSDRGTWLKFSQQIALTLLLDGDPTLFNQYGVVPVNPLAHPHINSHGANKFIEWLLSDQGQSTINGYLINGEQAFFANAAREQRIGQITNISLTRLQLNN